MKLDITDNQFCVLCDLHARKTVKREQCNKSELMTLLTLSQKSLVFNNGTRWTITRNGHDACNTYMQIMENAA